MYMNSTIMTVSEVAGHGDFSIAVLSGIRSLCLIQEHKGIKLFVSKVII